MSIAVELPTAPSIANRSDLIARVASALDRDDLNADEIPLFIAHAERFFNRVLRVRQMWTTASIVATSRDVALPADYLKMEMATRADGAEIVPVTLHEIVRRASNTDGVEVYAEIGGVPPSIRLAPTPTGELLDIIYYAKIPNLSENVPTNWLLDGHHDLYYFATLLHAEAYIANDDRVAGWQNALDRGISELIAADMTDRTSRTDIMSCPALDVFPRLGMLLG